MLTVLFLSSLHSNYSLTSSFFPPHLIPPEPHHFSYSISFPLSFSVPHWHIWAKCVLVSYRDFYGADDPIWCQVEVSAFLKNILRLSKSLNTLVLFLISLSLYSSIIYIYIYISECMRSLCHAFFYLSVRLRVWVFLYQSMYLDKEIYIHPLSDPISSCALSYPSEMLMYSCSLGFWMMPQSSFSPLQR